MSYSIGQKMTLAKTTMCLKLTDKKTILLLRVFTKHNGGCSGFGIGFRVVYGVLHSPFTQDVKVGGVGKRSVALLAGVLCQDTHFTKPPDGIGYRLKCGIQSGRCLLDFNDGVSLKVSE
jgi:hypothetical protein